MNTMMKLTAAALGAMSIAGGVAVAQGSTTSDNDARSNTANYGTPPGAALKRDGSLSADPKPTATMNAPSTTDTTSTTTRTTSTAAPVADTSRAAPAGDNSAPMANPSMQPRADRN